MKDIKDNEVVSGCHVHIWGTSKKDPDFTLDINALVANTRGRGIKFIDEVSGKEYPSSIIDEDKFNILVTENSIQEPKKSKKNSSSPITQEQLDLIDKLRQYGWYGTLTKNVEGSKYSVSLANPENI